MRNAILRWYRFPRRLIVVLRYDTGFVVSVVRALRVCAFMTGLLSYQLVKCCWPLTIACMPVQG